MFLKFQNLSLITYLLLLYIYLFYFFFLQKIRIQMHESTSYFTVLIQDKKMLYFEERAQSAESITITSKK